MPTHPKSKSLLGGPISAGLELVKAILGEDEAARLFASSALFPSSDRESQVLASGTAATKKKPAVSRVDPRADPKSVVLKDKKKRRRSTTSRSASLLGTSGNQTLG